MKSLTGITTLVAIIVGTGVVCHSLLVVFVGLVLGPLLLSPLFVTLILSRVVCGSFSQLILLSSTVLYSGYFSYLFYRHLEQNGNFDVRALTYSLPIMVGFWIAACVMREKSKDEAPNKAPQTTRAFGPRV